MAISKKNNSNKKFIIIIGVIILILALIAVGLFINNKASFTGKVISGNVVGPTTLKSCSSNSQCSSKICENRDCRVRKVCDKNKNTCSEGDYGFFCYKDSIGYRCKTECTSDSYCKKNGKAGEICNKNLGRCTECIKGSTNSKYKCKNAGEICNDRGECIAPIVPVCGNGKVETGEQCDDGNLINRDGCSSSCNKETIGRCNHNSQQGCGQDEYCDKNGNCIKKSSIDSNSISAGDIDPNDGTLQTAGCTGLMCIILNNILGATTSEPPPGYKICDLNKKAKSATCKINAGCGSTGGGILNPLPDVNFCDETSISCKSPNVLCPINEDAKGNICCLGGSGCEVSTLGLPYCTKKDGCKKGDEGYCADDLCCSEKEECKKGYGAAVCQPKEENSCDNLKETFCPGLSGSQGEERKRCCPKDTCRHMGNGYPYCYNP